MFPNRDVGLMGPAERYGRPEGGRPRRSYKKNKRQAIWDGLRGQNQYLAIVDFWKHYAVSTKRIAYWSKAAPCSQVPLGFFPGGKSSFLTWVLGRGPIPA